MSGEQRRLLMYQSWAWLLASCGGSGLASRDTWIQTASYRSFLLVWTVQGTIRGMPNRLGRFFWDDRKYNSVRIWERDTNTRKSQWELCLHHVRCSTNSHLYKYWKYFVYFFKLNYSPSSCAWQWCTQWRGSPAQAWYVRWPPHWPEVSPGCRAP